MSNSIGRGAVENFIKNTVYEKYNIDSHKMKDFSKLSPTEMISDFCSSVKEFGKLRSDYEAGKYTKSEYKVLSSKVKGEISGKMLEMGSCRKIPDRFKIDTPIGTYNPDWAVLWEKNGEQKLYFVIETKGTTTLFNLKTPEQLKIHCGMERFKALDNGIEMHIATDWNKFKVRLTRAESVMDSALNDLNR